MAESDSPKTATFVLIVMVGLWVVLLITMRAGITIPTPAALGPSGHATTSEARSTERPGSAVPTGEDEIAGDEYGVLQQVLTDYPQLTTLFEAAMVDGKMSYREAENILARKDDLEAEAEAGRQKEARERLLDTIEKLRKQ